MAQSIFTIAKLDDHVWHIVENDGSQQPHIFVVGGERLALIDTGTGTGDLKEFVERERGRGTFGERAAKERSPFIVVCTHIHFDHVGGAWRFPEGVSMGGAAREFTERVSESSLAGEFGAVVKPFKINHWLRNGDLIDLGVGHDGQSVRLEVIETPGHSFDSISLRFRNRIFVGDLICESGQNPNHDPCHKLSRSGSNLHLLSRQFVEPVL